MQLHKTWFSAILIAVLLCSAVSDKELRATMLAMSSKQMYMRPNPKADFALQPMYSGNSTFYIEVKYENNNHFLTILNKQTDVLTIDKKKVSVSWFSKEKKALTWTFLDNSGSSISLQADSKITTLKKRIKPGNSASSFAYVLYMDADVVDIQTNF